MEWVIVEKCCKNKPKNAKAAANLALSITSNNSDKDLFIAEELAEYPIPADDLARMMIACEHPILAAWYLNIPYATFLRLCRYWGIAGVLGDNRCC